MHSGVVVGGGHGRGGDGSKKGAKMLVGRKN